MREATRKPKGLGRLCRVTYTCERESRKTHTQGTESGRRWMRNQHRSREDRRRRSSGQKPASTKRLGIGDVRNAPIMDPLVDFQEFDLFEELEAVRVARSLLTQLHLPEANDSRGCPVPPYLQLLITLRWMATGDLQLTIGDAFEVSEQFVSACSSRTVHAIATLCEQYVQFPDWHHLRFVKENFNAIAGFPSVIGAIDCTQIPIMSPGGPLAEQFRCIEGFFSLNVQAVCGPDLKLYNIVCRWPGSVHDSRIFRNSALYAQLQGAK
ncbi:LOW QUALITY PROTEIN: putative nuclease HARBI1 [Portunus trituberculatus]|uniref:LOW QUALITY PROTEIN: putative nuclease HARBI1 n=1 Tax=Portunus trituberculatus TaxID=210409 RepID=UPI001E1CEE7F|nr:LOW QUALITY PROTEIN: putative nuclease HARBI1 [Portunus trituberculatus]